MRSRNSWGMAIGLKAGRDTKQEISLARKNALPARSRPVTRKVIELCPRSPDQKVEHQILVRCGRTEKVQLDAHRRHAHGHLAVQREPGHPHHLPVPGLHDFHRVIEHPRRVDDPRRVAVAPHLTVRVTVNGRVSGRDSKSLGGVASTSDPLSQVHPAAGPAWDRQGPPLRLPAGAALGNRKKPCKELWRYRLGSKRSPSRGSAPPRDRR